MFDRAQRRGDFIDERRLADGEPVVEKAFSQAKLAGLTDTRAAIRTAAEIVG